MKEIKVSYTSGAAEPPPNDKVLWCPGCGTFIGFIFQVYNGKIQLHIPPLSFYFIGGTCIHCGKEIKWSEKEGIGLTT